MKSNNVNVQKDKQPSHINKLSSILNNSLKSSCDTIVYTPNIRNCSQKNMTNPTQSPSTPIKNETKLSQSPSQYTITQRSSSVMLTPKTTQLNAQHQTTQMSTLKKQYESIIRNYQFRMKSLSQQYRRCRIQMQTKLKQIYKQKVYWYNIVSNISEKNPNININIYALVQQFHRAKNQVRTSQYLNSSRRIQQNGSQAQIFPQQSNSKTVNRINTFDEVYVIVGFQNQVQNQLFYYRNIILEGEKWRASLEQRVRNLQNDNNNLLGENLQYKKRFTQYLKIIYKLQNEVKQLPYNAILRKQEEKFDPSYGFYNHLPGKGQQSSYKRSKSQKSISSSNNRLRSQQKQPVVISLSELYQQQLQRNQQLCIQQTKQKTLISQLNEERIRSNMEKLEQKYKKIYGNSINYESKVGSTRSAIR